MKKGIRLYNLYPKLIGSIDKWNLELDRIQKMNFNWIYINPIHFPGFSGSSYSIKNYYLYHPLFTRGDFDFENLEDEKIKGDELLKEFCENAKSQGINVMMDIVINHTSFDSVLVDKHPEWYEKDENGDFAVPRSLENGEWIYWNDSFKIDNENSTKKEELWNYWLNYLMHYYNLGIKGFRCDAAYHIPSTLWEFLTTKMKEIDPEIIFLGETLGCTTEELIEIADSGFDIVMNSFLWWDFKEDWFLKDYSKWAGQVSSLTFPENHDTVRFAENHNGNKQAAITYYSIESYFCSSISITTGFEYGYRKRIDVVNTTPLDNEVGDYNIEDEISKINEIKKSYNILQEDNMIDIYNFYDDKIFSFTKKSLDEKEKIFVVANLDFTNGKHVTVEDLYYVLEGEDIEDISFGHKMEEIDRHLHYYLQPGEVKLFLKRS